jgi:oxygen-independent coproporphyrinogen III oxidase
MSGDIALYVHMPFCRRKCHYCSFISFAQREADIPAYMETLEKELQLRAHHEHITSIYLGGGTPSLVPAKSLEQFLSTIRKLCVIDKTAEISMEANPGTVNDENLAAIRQLGINRLSLGVQSFDDDELKMLGRIHSADEAVKAVHMARNSGFDNLNLDLIYGLPGQTEKGWEKSLTAAIALEPEHLSLYALTLEEDTPMQLLINDAGLLPIDPDMSATLYELAEDRLGEHGYRHYEISNWARDGRPCRHNLVYWHNLPYLGIGVAAHSCLDGHRLANTSNLDEYLAAFSGTSSYKPEMDEKIDPDLELAETIILGLRLDEGIEKEKISQRFGLDITGKFHGQIKEMTDAGLLIQKDGHIKLTGRGRLLSNQVFYRFLPEQ